MATVHYFEAAAATNSSLVSEFMPALHAALIAAGWTLEYADADAIGTSADPTDPAWDKTPVANTNAGIAVYRMPASAHATRWFVRLRPGWGGSWSWVNFRGFTVGTSHNGAGTVTGGAAEFAPANVGAVNTGRPWQVACSEDGMLFHMAAITTAAQTVYMERVRLLDETVQDDVIAFSSLVSYSGALVSVTAGVIPHSHYAAIACTAGLGNPIVNSSLHSDYADAWLFCGPYWLFGNPFTGLPRLWRRAQGGNVSPGATVMVDVDGGVKTYQVASLTDDTRMGYFVVATE